MATQAWSSPYDNTNNTTYNAWVNEWYQYLTATGLVQSGDTGQMAYPYSGGVPGANNTDAGYWIFYLNDSLHGSAPIYLRVAPGRAGNATAGRVMISAGTGTNGAGTLTGDTTTATTCINTSSSTTATNVSSRVCSVEGFVGLAWKLNAASGNGAGAFYLCRTCDNNGTPTADGYWLYCGGATSTSVANRVTSVDTVNHTVITSTATDSCQVTVIPQGLNASSATASGDLQAFGCFGAYRKLFPIFGVCALLQTEATDGFTVSVAMVGTTPRTYISNGSQYCGNPTRGGFSYFAMLWE